MKPITSGSLPVRPPSSGRQNSCGSSETDGNAALRHDEHAIRVRGVDRDVRLRAVLVGAPD